MYKSPDFGTLLQSHLPPSVSVPVWPLARRQSSGAGCAAAPIPCLTDHLSVAAPTWPLA